MLFSSSSTVKCHEIFDHYFFAEKIRPGPDMNRQKRFRKLFHFREDIQSQISKITCPRSQWPRWHDVGVVNYADTRFSQVSSRTQKISRNRFLPVNLGPRWSFFL